MKIMTAKEIRRKYLEFFEARGHSIIPGASLIPENDPTVLFTTAGMHPLVPFLLGEKHPQGKRLVNIQKCIRTSDIEEVGDTTHHTFFEMLGNWSLGNYFKKESLEWSWEFLTSSDWLGLDPNKIAVSIFEGNADASFDEESYNIWRKIGVPEKHIAKLGKKENWWGPAGETGPCGPCSEIFYWIGKPDKIPETFNAGNELWVEVWNNVFMEYNRRADGNFEKLAQKNVDTGMGLERITAVLQGLAGNYKTELWANIISKIEELSGKTYLENKKEMRIIADHIKASVFIISDGIISSNNDQGYVLRKLIRRAVRYGKMIGIRNNYSIKIAKIIIAIYKDIYKELEKNEDKIFKELEKEEKKFFALLEKVGGRVNNALYTIRRIKGEKDKERIDEKRLKEYSQTARINLVNDWKNLEKFNKAEKDFFIYKKLLPAIAFTLETTHGYPHSMFFEDDLRMKLHIGKDDIKKVNNFYLLLLKKHQELSRTAAAGKFKGGLADASEETTKLHTAAHLLLAALRKVLGDAVEQKGSNITPDRLRFDFSYSKKMTDEQKQEVEKLVNGAIQKKMPVVCEEMSLEEAKERGALGAFESKYGERVKVYKIAAGNEIFSFEICGGPHIKNTGNLGKFKIKKEQSSSLGVRRIKAVLE